MPSLYRSFGDPQAARDLAHPVAAGEPVSCLQPQQLTPPPARAYPPRCTCLHGTFAEVRQRPATARESAHIDLLAEELLRHVVEPMPGVVATLRELSSRNRLILLTKGTQQEQQAKMETSGLAHFFDLIVIVAEKDPSTYRAFLAEQHLEPGLVWMIGNSPRSDINPARAAGLGALFIPNPNTWALEQDDIDHGEDRILQLSSITELTEHF